ncbi:gamma-glutamyltranspeptidase [Limnohabitans sp. MORI2]|uniref:gamma-glutamyltransferase family protein n=1 Tax=Limnohabitans sp. MORI2 TaxID=1751150 RepID=UPI0023772C98|nr:gamma-glutamyltransferase family protein [Limnohabitans sp. MORI2]BDU59032.1 gamma-glutamyltranspeptidase [Limnohabitans sp. MORI2]
MTDARVRRAWQGKTLRRRIWPIALLLWLSACTTPPHNSTPLQPEIATGFNRKADVVTTQFAVAAANPLATQAGFDVLKAGGSAVDAAIAVQMVLGLVEPQSSGLGGGAFLLHSAGAHVQAFDGRETAPAAATEDLLLGPDGKPLAFHAAVVGGRAVGTPGVLRMLAQAHAQHGKLPWARLFEPAIRLATQGFAISPRLHAQLKADAYLRLDASARAYFYQANGEPHPVGHLLRNPELAVVLQRIATEGVQAFYSGEVAEAMVRKVQQHASNPGRMTLSDLANYQAKERIPLCFDHPAHARVYRICGFPPPSSGVMAIGQILGMLQHTPASMMSSPREAVDGTPDPRWLHLYAEASRLAFADRAHYVADPDFVPPPSGEWQSLLAPAYVRERAKLIRPTAMPQALPSVPVRGQRSSFAPMLDQPEYGTSHISIVDAQGNALAMTTTIEDAFGSRQMVKGFLLNNELTDFSFVPRDAQGRVVANRVQPNKRPRSSMSPLLVFDKATGELVASLGSPGGAMIIHFTAKTLYGVLNWGLSPQQAIALPNFGSVGGPMVLEGGRFAPATLAALRERGHEVREQALTSGLQAVVKQNKNGKNVWVSGADPRREGEVMGE